jgi:F-type H+-transporting ATPase subunit gamma
LVPVVSNRGLCGGFNNYVIKETMRLAKEEYNDKNVMIVPIGKKATDTFKKSPMYGTADFLPQDIDGVWNELNYANAAGIAETLMQAYTNKNVDKVVLVYNYSLNVATQIVQKSQLLPIVQNEASEKSTSSDYIYEPSQKEIVEELMPKTLKTQLYGILLESMAGEHGARMTAMHKATDNASELNKALKLQYNKARQAAITNEILEIVGGAEALNG